MSVHSHRRNSWLALGAGIAATLCCTPVVNAREQPGPALHVDSHNGIGELMRRELIGSPGKEVVMSTVEMPPGSSTPPHRHDAQVFVYVLAGHVIMQVKGGPRLTLGPGQTFYESPTDIHLVSANASKTEPAKFLAFLIKDKGTPALILVPAAATH